MNARTSARLVAIAAASLALVGCLGEEQQATDATAANPPGISPAPKNDPPTISGKPASEVAAGTQYVFTPQASDADGDSLHFEITGKPAWAAFDAAIGRLSGTPRAADTGIYGNIRITVSDGRGATSKLDPFSIKVDAEEIAPPFDKDADFAARVAQSKAWYANNFSQYGTVADMEADGGSTTEEDSPLYGRLDLNTESRYALSGGKSIEITMTPTSKQGGKWRQFFSKHAPAGPQKDGDQVREFYLQYAVYWTHEAMTWTHRDAQTGEAFKTLLLEGYGNGQLMPGMLRRIPVVRTSVNGSDGCSRLVRTPSGREYRFIQSAVDDPAVTITSSSLMEDYIAKYGLTASVRTDSRWGYVTANTDWSYKGRWETGGDWTKNLIDHPDRGHPYGGWGWPELQQPADQAPWVMDGWTVVEIYVRQDPTVIGYTADGKPQYNPQTFRIWAAPYGQSPRLVIDSETSGCELAYNSTYYQWFELLFYDTNIVEGAGFGAKVDARSFTPTTTQFELVYESGADDRPKGHPFYAIENPSDKTVGKDQEFLGNRVGFNTGELKGQLFTITASKYMGLVQDGTDSEGRPIMKHKTRLTVEPMPVAPVGGTGTSEGFGTTGDYLQVQTYAEEGYRPPLSIYYDELLMAYAPIPFPGHPEKTLPGQ